MTDEEHTRKVFASHVGETAGTRSAAIAPACVLYGPMPDFRIEAQRKAGWCKCKRPVSVYCQRNKEEIERDAAS